MSAARIPFLSLAPGEDRAAVAGAIDRVVTRGRFILGPEVEAFETEFARASGAAHAVGVGNGTDAIALTLRALGIGAGDEVVTSAFTHFASVEAILWTGAIPVFADVEPDGFGIDPAAVARALGPRCRAVLAVHLFGRCADVERLRELADAAGIALVEDAAQAFGAARAGRRAGAWGRFGGFSF